MKIKHTISAEEHKRLQEDSVMLSRIASVVSRYARKPDTTTYECVVALNERVRTLNKKMKEVMTDHPKREELKDGVIEARE